MIKSQTDVTITLLKFICYHKVAIKIGGPVICITMVSFGFAGINGEKEMNEDRGYPWSEFRCFFQAQQTVSQSYPNPQRSILHNNKNIFLFPLK